MRRRAALALGALGLIAAVTASWWALALWPLPAGTPAWLTRTRDVCFGNAADGLPSAGGWVLLVGEPAGMLGILLVVWGDAVREGVGALGRRWAGRLALGAAVLGLFAGIGWAVGRVREARGAAFDPTAAGRTERVDAVAPPLRLVDQAGDTVGPARYAGRAVVVTFAYGHCETVCPTTVRDLVAAAGRLGARAPEILIVTLDPWRDTPARLGAIAAAWRLPEGVHVLSGDTAVVAQALDDWRIPRSRDLATGEVAHPRVAYLLGPNGRIAFRLGGGTDGVVEAVGEVE